jgi:hypothetical protein
MKAIHRYALAAALTVALAAPSAAAAVLLPIDPVTHKPVVRKAKPKQAGHVRPVRKKPPLEP